jgi:hypothetical protein
MCDRIWGILQLSSDFRPVFCSEETEVLWQNVQPRNGVDIIDVASECVIRSTRWSRVPPQEGSGGTAPQARARVGQLGVVEAEERLPGLGELPPAGEGAAPPWNSPKLPEQGSLRLLDAAVRPSVPGLKGVCRSPQSQYAGRTSPLNSLSPSGGTHRGAGRLCSVSNSSVALCALGPWGASGGSPTPSEGCNAWPCLATLQPALDGSDEWRVGHSSRSARPSPGPRGAVRFGAGPRGSGRAGPDGGANAVCPCPRAKPQRWT